MLNIDEKLHFQSGVLHIPAALVTHDVFAVLWIAEASSRKDGWWSDPKRGHLSEQVPRLIDAQWTATDAAGVTRRPVRASGGGGSVAPYHGMVWFSRSSENSQTIAVTDVSGTTERLLVALV